MTDDFSIGEMQQMQKTLQEKYKDKWEKISPEAGKHKLLWMIGEVGEVIDIVKKKRRQKSHRGCRRPGRPCGRAGGCVDVL